MVDDVVYNILLSEHNLGSVDTRLEHSIDVHTALYVSAEKYAPRAFEFESVVAS